MAERVGFEPLNAEPCTVLRGLVQTQETRHLLRFEFTLDLVGMFYGLIPTEDVASSLEM